MMNQYSIYFVAMLLVGWVLPAVGQAAITDTLGAGTVLSFDQSIVSKNGDFRAVFQRDGNLVLLDRRGLVLWNSQTEGRGATQLIMQADGNLVIYSNNAAVWDTKTVGTNGGHLVIQNDGNLVLYDISGKAKWDTNTRARPFAYWMESHLNVFGNTALNKMAIAGSHDSGMSKIDGHTYFGKKCNTVTQTSSIFGQLLFGVRYFDIRPVIGNGGQLLTGHYAKTTIFEVLPSWQGANGESIASIVNAINNFTKHSNELIILRISHDLNTDGSNFNYPKFSSSEWNRLISELNKINALYAYIPASGPGPHKLNELHLGDFILDNNGNPRPAVLLVFDGDVPLGAYDGQGFYHATQPEGSNYPAIFPVFDKFADKNTVSAMASDQLKKMFQNSQNYFLLSWTLTQSKDQAANCFLPVTKLCPTWEWTWEWSFGVYRKVFKKVFKPCPAPDSILGLAQKANDNLHGKLFPYISKHDFPNIIYLDKVDSDFAGAAPWLINQFLSTPLPSSPKWILRKGEVLNAGSQLETADGRFKLVMQLDGNLVLYQNIDNFVVWETETQNHPGAYAIMQMDGNFVVYHGGIALWNSKSEGKGGVELILQNDRNLVIYDAAGHARWASNTDIPEVIFNRPPVANAGTAQTVESTGATTAVILNGSLSSDPDGDPLTYAWSLAGGSVPGVSPTVKLANGTYNITLTVDDGQGHAATATTSVIVQDTVAPVISIASIPATEATSASGAVVDVSGYVTVTDVCGVSLVISPAGPYPLGTTSVSVTASDCANNTSSTTVDVTVVDTTAPVLTVPANVSIEANAVLSTVALGTATATDIFGATVANDAPATFPLGTTVVTYTATDGNGLTSTGAQTVTVVDATAPALTLPADIIGFEATGSQTAVAIGTATATDIFNPVTVVSNAPVTYPLGTTVVTWTATDVNGNVATGTQNVNVVDTTAPVVTADLTPFSRGDDDGHGKGDSDEGRFKVQFAATDLVGVTSLTAELVINGYATPVTVSLNQVIEFEYEKEKTQVKTEKGVLEIEAPSILLRVTAKDSSDNTTVVDIQPRRLMGDHDDGSDHDDESDKSDD